MKKLLLALLLLIPIVSFATTSVPWQQVNLSDLFITPAKVNGLNMGLQVLGASTTLQNFTFINATGTRATTTSFFSTTGTFSNLFGTLINGFGLSTCNGANQAVNWALGSFGCTTITSGTGNVSTSTAETAGFLSYWTSTAGTPALLGKVATTSLAVSSPLTVTGTLGALVGGSNSTINCQTASGSQAGCLSATDWTTFNNKGSGTVTAVTGTANRITSTGGATPAIDISASYVGQSSITTVGTLSSGAVPASLVTTGTFGTGNYIFPAQLQVNSSTTLQNFTGVNSTTTNATTTSLSLSSLFRSGTTDGCATWASGLLGTTGSACGSGSGGSSYPFPLTGNATSTLTQFNGGLTAYATSTIGAGGQTTGLTISGGATTTGNTYLAGRVGIGATPDPSSFLLVQGDVSSGIATFNRINASTNSGVRTVVLKGTSLGDMTDGFGPAINFTIQDNAGVENNIGDINFARDGADNSGTIYFDVANAGSLVTPLQLNKDFSSTFGGDLKVATGKSLLLSTTGSIGSSVQRALKGWFTNVDTVNSTSTNATSTNFFATTASSTNNYSTSYFGAGLADCNAASSALTYTLSTGRYGCNTISGGGTPGGTNGQIQFNDGGTTFGGAAGSFYDKNYGAMGWGTTTPRWLEQLASSTRPQLALSDPSSLTNNHWTFRNAGGILYMATANPSTFATTTNPALSLTSGGTLTTQSDITSTTGSLTVGNVINYGTNLGLINISGVKVYNPAGTSYLANNGDSGNTSAGLSANSGTGALTSYIFLDVGNAGNGSTAADKFRLYGSGFGGFATITPQWLLQLSTSTRSQLTLTDPSGTPSHWSFRNYGGWFALATSSPSTFATSTVNALTINTNGYFGIASNTPTYTLSLGGTMGAPNLATGAGNGVCFGAGGQILNGGAVSCTTSSKKTKHDIQSMSPEDSLAEILKLRPVSYEYNGTNEARYGLVAEEASVTDSRLVEYAQKDTLVTGVDGKQNVLIKKGEPYTVDYERSVTALNTSAIQALAKKIESSASGGRRSIEENWQDVLICLLVLGFGIQQVQINRLKKK